MIVAKNFRLEERPGAVRAICDVEGEGFGFPLWFDAHPSQIEALDVDEPNWAAISLLYPAMLMKRTLVIEANLSPLLLDNMRNDLMALIHNYEALAKPVAIEAGTSTSPRYRQGGKDVVTGMSFGVDSCSTLMRYTAPDVPPDIRLTAVAVWQVGAFGKTSNPDFDIERPRMRCEALVGPLGLGVYSANSNMDDVFKPAAAAGAAGFAKTVGFRNAAAALLHQKRVGRYLASSNVEYARASYGPRNTTENIDPAFQPLLSTEALQFQSSLAGMARYDKIAALADNPFAQQNLDVCCGPVSERFIGGAVRNNCSQCWKCSQTMIALESMGKLEAFGAVFNLDLFRRNRQQILLIAVNNAQKRGAASAAYSVIERARLAGLDLPQPDSNLVLTLRKWRKTLRHKAGRIRRMAWS